MICFQDKTYCSAVCTNTRCARSQASEAKDRNRLVYLDEMPTAWADFSGCCLDYTPTPEAVKDLNKQWREFAKATDDAIRNAALEEAAKLCEKYPHFNLASENADRDHIQKLWGKNLASRIRSLKTPEHTPPEAA